MFGYVVPQKSELKVKELALYQAYYCGICKSVSARYGEPARLTLNYDCSFLALLLDGLGQTAACQPQRCMYKPMRPKRPVAQENESIAYAADVNILLAVNKLMDDWADERNPLSRAGAFALAGAYKAAKKYRPELADAFECGMKRLREIERAQSDQLDTAADAFGLLLQAAATYAPICAERDKRILEQLLYNLGRWIYLADAWDDREKDKKHGSYNIFNLTDTGVEKASFLLHISVNRAIMAYELLDIGANKGVLDNIMYEGCTEKTRILLGGLNDKPV